MGTERQTNLIINNIYIHFACSEEVSWPVCKNVNGFVSVNCSVQRKRSNRNLVFLFSFEKHLLPLKNVGSIDSPNIYILF